MSRNKGISQSADPYEDEYDEDVEDYVEEDEEDDEVELDEGMGDNMDAIRKKMEELDIKVQARESRLVEEEEEAERERLGINSKVDVYRPSEHFDNEEFELTFQNKAYELHYKIRNEWPALSFDIISQPSDNTSFPLSCYFVVGVQTDSSVSQKNCYLIKAYDMYKTRYDSDESDVEDEDENLDDEPSLEYQAIPIPSNVNRVRTMPQNRNIVSFWCEDSKVHIYDLSHMYSVLKQENMANALKSISKSKKPLQTFDFHSTEGFAMDWSKCVEGRLATGDCNGEINVMDMTNNGGVLSWKRIYEKPFTGHIGSVEDIQFSPNEESVLASCSCDRTIKFWDTRRKNRKSALGFEASEKSDVNVISWNPTTTYLIASGDDSGVIRIWDIRQCSDSTPMKPVGQFTYHNSSITSIEWNPTDPTSLAASDADQVTIWDLGLERDAEQEQIEKDIGDGIPPQLLFVHMGQTNIKEVHWHPRIENLLVTTSLDGYAIFKPANLAEEDMEDEDME